MKKILKGVSILLIVLISIISLVGCNNGIEGENMTFETFQKALDIDSYENITLTSTSNEYKLVVERLNDKVKQTSYLNGELHKSSIINYENKLIDLIISTESNIDELFKNISYDKQSKKYNSLDEKNNYEYCFEIKNKKLIYVSCNYINDNSIVETYITYNQINSL